MVSSGEARASRSMGGLRLDQELEESPDWIDLLDRRDPEREFMECSDWALEHDEDERSKEAELLSDVRLERDETESVDALGCEDRSIVLNGRWMCSGSEVLLV